MKAPLIPLVLGIAVAAPLIAAEPAGTNLLSNGSFEKPVQWGRDWDTPQKPLVHVVGNGNHGAKCMHMKVPPKEAAVEGVVFKSEFVPCEPGGRYRLRCDLKGTGTTVIVFVEAYDPQYIDRPQGDYRTQAVRTGSPKEWKTFEDTFQIRRSRKSTAVISKMQVKVFAYYPQGEVWLDNLILEPLPPEPAAETKTESATPPR